MNIPSHNPKTLELQLRKIISGIEKNAVDWPQSNQVNKEVLLSTSDELNEKLKEIKKFEKKISEMRKRLLEFVNQTAKPFYKKARDRAYSIHGKNSDKLNEYSFKKI
ncbi:MAG: hypothetical protein J0M18_12890 [Ignavibacteria bacterium]|nr:hypothetical protein [Ignavibacteria bacterium]